MKFRDNPIQIICSKYLKLSNGVRTDQDSRQQNLDKLRKLFMRDVSDDDDDDLN